MIQKHPYEITMTEKQWIHKSLSTQRDSLLRGRQKEMTGSEIWQLRGKEIEILNGLINKFA